MRCWPPVMPQRLNVDPAGAVTARLAAASGLQRTQRAAADGAVELQLAVPLVRGSEHRRPGVGSLDLFLQPVSTVRRRDRPVLLRTHRAAGPALAKVNAWVHWNFAAYNLIRLGGIGEWWNPSPT